MKTIKSYSYEGLFDVLKELNEPRFRRDQLVQWLYATGVSSYEEMTNLPQALRKKLQEEYAFTLPKVINKQVSSDGTRKYVLELFDGTCVETVAIPTVSSGNEKQTKRLTVCVSTQVGCPMACSFCATGEEGFTRNLLPGEIVDQVLIVQKDFDERVSNVVTMGQGEPFLNYANTLAALELLNHPKGLSIGARHITVSTCGILEGIRSFANQPEQFTLALSLHSANQKTRDFLMPKCQGEKIPQIKTALESYVKHTNRRVTLEYAMIREVNDTPEALNELISFCKDLLCHVNLLPMNNISESPFSPSSQKTVSDWLRKLEKAHIPVTTRNSRGSDIAGACGQLKNSL